MKLYPFDPAEFLTNEERIEEYLRLAMEESPEVFAAALNDAARARGMTRLARETGYTRDGLYKALSSTGNPSFALIQKVLGAMGLKLTVVKV